MGKKKAAFAQQEVQVRSEAPRPMRKISYPLRFTPMTVETAEDITPTMRRVVMAPVRPSPREPFESQALMGEYVRVVVPPTGAPEVPEPQWQEGTRGLWPVWQKPAPPSRKYTVRNYWSQTQRVEINVTLHEKGPGSDWARSVQPGATTYVLGPKSGYRVSYDYDFYLMVCDQTGLPGVARWLEQLPSTAGGHVFVKIPAETSVQDLTAPPGMQISWVLPPQDLAGTVMASPRPAGYVFTWIAGESTSIKPLRSWIRHEWGLSKSDGYSSGYWKDKSLR
ncbi:siderophore-interacting protein [Nesterenkonia muleiensis]|uniref:siderophore-interacting protein n=1 Tax=Nesterenkonia muleiensis TaxID=2282648 RepID=UPI001300593C|nr:siderophore-interacting protein [Nesterenkonia muleiensis]